MQNAVVIEDHMGTRLAFRNMLDQRGVEVREVVNADQLRTCLDEEAELDLLVIGMDTQLANPQDLINIFRVHRGAKFIVALVTDDQRRSLPQLSSFVVNDFMMKPTERHEIEARLNIAQQLFMIREELFSSAKPPETINPMETMLEPLSDLLARSLEGILGQEVAVKPSPEVTPADRMLTATGGLILIRGRTGRWLILQVRTSAPSMERMAKLMGHAGDHLEALQTLLERLQEEVGEDVQGLEADKALRPFAPTSEIRATTDAMPSGAPRRAGTSRFVLGSARSELEVEAYLFSAPLSKIALDQVTAGHVLAASAKRKDNSVTLIPSGTSLHTAHARRIHVLMKEGIQTLQVFTLPPPLLPVFLPELTPVPS
ncbi:MAG: hypothetical protein AAGI71_03900 [Bacteroidota bacterium]